jgi:hypothetical protein
MMENCQCRTKAKTSLLGIILKKKDRGFNSGRAESQRKSSSSQGISPTGGGSSQTRLSFERISYRLKRRCLHRKSIDGKSSCVIKIDWIKRL